MYTPVHVDLLTHDLERASQFWSRALGWEPLRLPHAPISFMETRQGPGGALVQVRAAQAPRVLVQISVPDCLEVARHAAHLGGHVRVERADLGRGTFCVVEDPWGNTIALVEGFSEGMLCLDVGWGPAFRRVEIPVGALAEGIAFYERLLGWSFVVEPQQRLSANQVRAPEQRMDICLVEPTRAYHDHLTLFIDVDDVRQALRRIERLRTPMTHTLHIHPSLGLCAAFRDPDGHHIALCARSLTRSAPAPVRPELRLVHAAG